MKVLNIIIGFIFCALLFSCKESNSYKLKFVENEALHVSKHDNRIVIYSSSDTLAELEYKNDAYRLVSNGAIVMSIKEYGPYRSIHMTKSGDFQSFVTTNNKRFVIVYDSCFNIKEIYNYACEIHGYDFPSDTAKDYRLMDWKEVEEHRPYYDI